MAFIVRNLSAEHGFENRRALKVLAAFSCALNIAFFVILLLHCIRSKNSGIVIAFVVNALCAIGVLRCNLRILFSSILLERWYSHFLLYQMFHTFVLLCVFWLTLLLIILNEHFDTGFWNAVRSLMSGPRTVIWLMLIVKILYDLLSVTVLWAHNCLMASIESQEERLMVNPIDRAASLPDQLSLNDDVQPAKAPA